MRRRRRIRSGIHPTLFPFLAVLICTMGVMIVLLVLGVQQAQAWTEGEGAEVAPVSGEHELFESVGVESRGIRGSDHGAGGRAGDDVGADLSLVEHLEHAHVRGSERAPASQGEAEPWLVPQVPPIAHAAIVGSEMPGRRGVGCVARRTHC